MGNHPVGFIDLSYGVKLRNKTLRVFKNPKGLFILSTAERPVPGFSPAFAWIIR